MYYKMCRRFHKYVKKCKEYIMEVFRTETGKHQRFCYFIFFFFRILFNVINKVLVFYIVICDNQKY